MAISQDSRYQEAAREFAACHTYSAERAPDINTTTGKPLETVREASYLLTVLPFPDPPETQYMVKESDNIQSLAAQFLNDARKWWKIADINPQVRYPLDLKMADVIYIPD